jgi:hypothetical protein
MSKKLPTENAEGQLPNALQRLASRKTLTEAQRLQLLKIGSSAAIDFVNEGMKFVALLDAQPRKALESGAVIEVLNAILEGLLAPGASAHGRVGNSRDKPAVSVQEIENRFNDLAWMDKVLDEKLPLLDKDQKSSLRDAALEMGFDLIENAKKMAASKRIR